MGNRDTRCCWCRRAPHRTRRDADAGARCALRGEAWAWVGTEGDGAASQAGLSREACSDGFVQLKPTVSSEIPRS